MKNKPLNGKMINVHINIVMDKFLPLEKQLEENKIIQIMAIFINEYDIGPVYFSLNFDQILSSNFTQSIDMKNFLLVYLFSMNPYFTLSHLKPQLIKINIYTKKKRHF